MADKYTFQIDDGTKLYSFVNMFGEPIGEMHFRGGDISILDRYNSLLVDFEKIIEPIKDIHMKDDGTSSFDEEWEKIKEVEKNLISRINAIFDSKDAENLFKNRNAFSTINGKFYIEHVIESLGNVVAQEMENERKKADKRLEKYKKDLNK